MFRLFKNNTKIKIIDRIALTNDAKWKNCFDSWKTNPAIIFIAWFDDTLNEFEEYIQKFSVEKPAMYSAKEIKFMHVQSNAAFIFIEHHPLRTKEIALFEKLHLKEAIIYSSLNEPLFIKIGSEKIILTMQSLGMNQDEVLEHKLISAAIKNLQQKLESNVSFEKTARSQKEWINLNTTGGSGSLPSI